MSFNYGPLRAKADELLGRFGFIATLERAGAPSGDPWDRGAPSASTRHPMKVVQQYERVRDNTGSLIDQSLHTLVVSAMGVPPRQGDRVALAAPDAITPETRWIAITDVRPVAPGNVAVLYEVDLVD